MATPSLVSDSDGRSDHSESPSRVTGTPHLFADWSLLAQVFAERITTPEILNHFDDLYRLEALPLALSQGILQKPCWHDGADFLRTVCQWASSFGTTEEDTYGVLDVLHHLALAHNRIKKTANDNTKEYRQRRGIDDIIEAAFSGRFDRFCDFRTEESYRIVGWESNLDATADTLITISSELIDYKVSHYRHFLDAATGNQMFWSTSVEEPEFSIIGFAAEFKKDDTTNNKNRLLMVLRTAQLQRRALFLKDSIIMGATGCRGIVKIYSSYWREGDPLLHIYEHKEQFNLTDPIQVVHLYLFLSRLQEHLQHTFALELQTWEPPDKVAIKDCTWRSRDKVKRRRLNEDGESASDNNDGMSGIGRGGGAVDADDVDADELDDDQVMKIMKWRDAIVDVKEVIALSNQGEILSSIV